MRTIYIADDGKQFDKKWDCEDYEAMINHPNLNYVTWILEDGSTCGKSRCTEDYVYNNSVRIIVPTDEAAKEVQWLSKYCGFCAYETIDSMGVWEFQGGSWDGRFVKVEEVK